MVPPGLSAWLYWNASHPILAISGTASVMPRVRFEQLFRFLHLSDSSCQLPSGNPGHDKLFKVRKRLDLVNPQFEHEYVLHISISIDEAMIPIITGVVYTCVELT